MRSVFTEDAANNVRPVSPSCNTAAHPVISIVVPAHNEEPGIASALEAINPALGKRKFANEIIVVVDSTDNTYAVLARLCEEQDNLRAIKLSRNFGKESAMLAGLQHPPELIPEMIVRWQDGAKVVHAIKRQRTMSRHTA